MKYFLFSVLIIFCSKSNAQEIDLNPKHNVGKEYFNYVIHTSKTDSITSKALLGKVTFINFWFEACKPCMAEMDALIELYNEFKDSSKFQMVTFTTDHDTLIQKNLKKYHIPFQVYNLAWQDCEVMNFGLGFPCSILLDEKKTVINMTSGGSTNKTEARENLRKEFVELIKEKLKK
jgi:thiol-disulfide isomerase/thioredoxin